MEAYRVILSYLATGTIIQVCFIYVCTSIYMPVQLRCWQVFIHEQMRDCTIYGLYHQTDIVYLWYNPNLYASYFIYYNVYITVYRIMQIEINWLIDWLIDWSFRAYIYSDKKIIYMYITILRFSISTETIFL